MRLVYTLLQALVSLKKNEKYDFFDRNRCWGYFLNHEDALTAVKTNEGDMWEDGYYQYVIIEKVKQGICNYDDDAIIEWFKFVDGSNKNKKYNPQWKRCNEPKEAKNIVGWSLG